MESSTVLNISFNGSSVSIVIILKLDHTCLVSWQKQDTSFHSRTSQQSCSPSGLLFSGCCGILPQRCNSWCMRLITQLCYLLRLQISAVVTVLPVCMSSLCKQGHLYLLPLCWRNDSNMYKYAILFCRKWVRYGVMELCAILQYCVVSKHRMLSDYQFRTWKLGNLFACGFPSV